MRWPLLTPEVGGNLTAQRAELLDALVAEGAHTTTTTAAGGLSCARHGPAWGATAARTNGKAERFVQSALREWAYGRAYQNADERRAALPAWNHFYYCIACQPSMSRLSASRTNLLTLHT